MMLIAVVLLLASTVALGASGAKFYKDDPIAVEPETQDASGAVYRKIDLFYDLMRNQFSQPGEPAGPRAQNINTIDEVPDSSWFTNRILARRFAARPAARGRLQANGR
jgi:hypothetical protein